MLDFITDFISNNTQMVIVAVIALVVMVGMYMFKPQMFKKPEEQPFQVPGMDMDMNMNMDMQTQMEMPMDNGNGMCNMDTGVCQSHQEMEQQQMTPEMQQQMMQEQQQMTPEMQQQMMQEQQQMTPENEMSTEM